MTLFQWQVEIFHRAALREAAIEAARKEAKRAEKACLAKNLAWEEESRRWAAAEAAAERLFKMEVGL